MNEEINLDQEQVVGMTTEYLRRLIIEEPYIRAKLENPGGSVILLPVAATTEQQHEYSTQIGNTFHNDLIEAHEILETRFSKGERQLLYEWASGLNARQAADYYGVKGSLVRKRRQRAVAKLQSELNGRREADGGRSNGDTSPGQQGTGEYALSGRDTGRTQAEVD